MSSDKVTVLLTDQFREDLDEIRRYFRIEREDSAVALAAIAIAASVIRGEKKARAEAMRRFSQKRAEAMKQHFSTPAPTVAESEA